MNVNIRLCSGTIKIRDSRILKSIQELTYAPVPVASRKVGGGFVNVNDRFLKEFGLTLSDLNNRSFQDLWGASEQKIIHRVDNFIKRTGQALVFTGTVIHPRTGEPVELHNVAVHQKIGGEVYRHSVFISLASEGLKDCIIQ